MSEISEKISKELGAFANAAAAYFNKYNEQHEASDDPLKDFVKNATKAHKAAYKKVQADSEMHKEWEKQTKNMLGDEALDDINDWVDKDD